MNTLTYSGQLHDCNWVPAGRGQDFSLLCLLTYVYKNSISCFTSKNNINVKDIKICNAILVWLKVYNMCNMKNVLVQCPAYRLVNQNVLVWSSEVDSGKSSVYVCHTTYTCVKIFEHK